MGLRIVGYQRIAVALCVARVLIGASASGQTTYKWLGGTSTDFTDSSNWQAPNGVAPVSGTYANSRISVQNGANNPLYYTATQGTTIYQNAAGARSLFIASGGSGSMVMTGGSFESRTAAEDGISNGSDGSLVMDGGTYIKTAGANNDFLVKFGGGGTATLTINSGLFSVGRILYRDGAGASGIVNLDGGVLAAGSFHDNGNPTSIVNFNGGTLKPLDFGQLGAYLQGLDSANVLAGGAVIDTDGLNITIAQSLLDGGGGGGLSKSGSGRLTLSGANTFTGPVVVNVGEVRITDAAGVGAIAGDTTVVGDGPRLELAGGISVAGETINIAGKGGNNMGALQSVSGDNAWNGPVVIGANNARVGAVNNAVLRIGGTVDDGASAYPFNVRNGTTGVTVLSGVCTCDGVVNVIVGTLRLDGGDDRLPANHSLVLGNSANVDSATLDLNGRNQTVYVMRHVGTTMPVILTDSVGGGTLTVDYPSGSTTFRGDVVGPLTIAKSGNGTYSLTGDLDRTDLSVAAGALGGSATWHCLLNGSVAEDSMTVTGGTLDIRNVTVDFDVGAGVTADDYVIVDYSGGGTLQANAAAPFFGSVTDLPAGYQLVHNTDTKQIILASDDVLGANGMVIQIK